MPAWTRDGWFVYVIAAEEGHASVKRIDVETETFSLSRQATTK
jgi:hypothetical protein